MIVFKPMHFVHLLLFANLTYCYKIAINQQIIINFYSTLENNFKLWLFKSCFSTDKDMSYSII